MTTDMKKQISKQFYDLVTEEMNIYFERIQKELQTNKDRESTIYNIRENISDLKKLHQARIDIQNIVHNLSLLE